MANGLYLLTTEELQRFVEAVKCCIGRYAHIPIIEVVKAVGRVAQLLLQLSVPRAVDA